MLKKDLETGSPEVVHPADIIQKLLKNSLDAGATVITVEINNGGVTYLRVTDNGCGIPYEAFPDILQIPRNESEKFLLTDMIPHCEFRMSSRVQGEESGGFIHFMHGRLLDYKRLQCSYGTDISVINPFFDTPHKYRHLRKDYEEKLFVIDMVQRFCLAQSQASIKLINNGSILFLSPGNGNLSDTAAAIFRNQGIKPFKEVEYKNRYKIFVPSSAVHVPLVRGPFVFCSGKPVFNQRIVTIFNQISRELSPNGMMAPLILTVGNPDEVEENDGLLTPVMEDELCTILEDRLEQLMKEAGYKKGEVRGGRKPQSARPIQYEGVVLNATLGYNPEKTVQGMETRDYNIWADIQNMYVTRKKDGMELNIGFNEIERIMKK